MSMSSRLLAFLSKTKVAISKLFFFLIVLPFTFTWLHVEYSLHNLTPQSPTDRGQSGQICFVSASVASFNTEESSIVGGVTENLERNAGRTESDQFSLHSLVGLYIRQDEHTFVLSSRQQQSRWNYIKWPSAMTFFHKYRALIRNGSTSAIIKASGERAAKLQYMPEMQRFCLVVGDGSSIVSCDSRIAIKTRSNYFVPQTSRFGASWKPQLSQVPMPIVQAHVYCPTTPMETEANQGGKKKRKAKKKKLLFYILHHPITSLLLAGQVYLAFLYWNNSTPVSSVAHIYSSIVLPSHYEIWRVFSGAFSHFALVHLGFNMMTLHSLGTLLENNLLDAPTSSFSSIEFLAYNLALVIFTTGTMIGITYLQIQYARRKGHAQQEQQLLNTPVIGFSGVLFAWMVVQTLDYAESCPIPFMFPDLCFATHTIPFVNLRWNISPIISLAFTQVIIRNASFVGHLSGIICGYIFVHIGVVPFKLLVPTVLIPWALVGHYWYIQGIIPLVKSTRDKSDDAVAGYTQGGFEDDEHNNSTEEILLNPLLDMPHRTADESSKDLQSTSDLCNESNVSPGNLRNIQTLRRVRSLMLVICILSALILEYDLMLGQFGITLLFYFATSHYIVYLFHSITTEMKDQRKQEFSTLLRGFFVCTVIIVVVDSMTFGCYMTSGASIWLPSSYPRKLFFQEFGCFCLVVAIRLTGNISGMVAAAKVLSDEGLVVRNGVFENLLGYLYRPALRIGENALVPDLVPFEGRGFILGTRSRMITSFV